MKIKINRNIFWTSLFVKRLSSLGLKNVCISPGSRSTPLTFAFASEKKINSYVHIDERSSAFFALGLAKATGMSAVLVSTSGTAAAEFYPAIIEAYQQRVPLIICTADRPPDQRGKGANQTINQDNLYKNHIRLFIDAGLPVADRQGKDKIISIAEISYLTSLRESGPVHINFPFKKPFEPDALTDAIDKNLLSVSSHPGSSTFVNNGNLELIKRVINFHNEGKKILFIAGPGSNDPPFNKSLLRLAKLTGSPVFADVYSHLRFGNKGNDHIITTYDAMLRSPAFNEKVTPDLIIQFGRTPTSKALLNFIAESSGSKIIINKYGDHFDPSGTAETICAMDPADFCERIIQSLKTKTISNEWLNLFADAEHKLVNLRDKILDSAKYDIESRVIRDTVEIIPSDTPVMVSNSSPIRELDYVCSTMDKGLNLFYNRGASGIDGITSTALGISAGLNKPAVLITGDLAFLYDITALHTGNKYNIPLTVVLINNNGGGIFHNLPVSDYKNIFNNYFITPHNLEFGSLAEAFGWDHKIVKNSTDFKKKLKKSIASGGYSVLEIKTDAPASLKLRKKYWAASAALLKH